VSGSTRSPRALRQPQILNYVLERGSATSGELAAVTGVSLMTIHRDIEELTGQGLLRKFHGGVSAERSTVFESSSEYRHRLHVAEKERLAQAALQLIEPGMSLMLDDSTSTFSLAKLLKDVGPLTVATNYLPTIDLLRRFPDVHLITIGGEYSRTHESFLGVAAVEAIERLTVDMVFVSTSAMNGEMTFHQEQATVQVKQPMLAAGKFRVLMMDPSKLPKTALYRIGPVESFSTVILGEESDAATVAEIRERTAVKLVP
jgi:DeoR/GlpR family transcriptional regulator of sugar metabolism